MNITSCTEREKKMFDFNPFPRDPYILVVLYTCPYCPEVHAVNSDDINFTDVMIQVSITKQPQLILCLPRGLTVEEVKESIGKLIEGAEIYKNAIKKREDNGQANRHTNNKTSKGHARQYRKFRKDL